MSTAVKPTIPIRDSSGNDHPVNASKFVTTIPVNFFVKSPELVDSYVPFFMTAAEIIKIKQERNRYNGARFSRVSISIPLPSDRGAKSNIDGENSYQQVLLFVSPEDSVSGAFAFGNEHFGILSPEDQIFIARNIDVQRFVEKNKMSKLFHLLRAELSSTPVIRTKEAIELLLKRADVDVKFKEKYLARHLISVHLHNTIQHREDTHGFKPDIGALSTSSKLDLKGTGISLENVFARMLKIKDQIRPFEVLLLAHTQLDVSEALLRNYFINGVRSVLENKEVASSELNTPDISDATVRELRSALALVGDPINLQLGAELSSVHL